MTASLWQANVLEWPVVGANEEKLFENKLNKLIMEQHQFWSLLARKLAGEASLRELYELEKVTYEQPELQFFSRLVTDLWRNREAIEVEPGGEEKFLQLFFEAYRTKYLRNRTNPQKEDCFFFRK